jgi:hypothetical protein
MNNSMEEMEKKLIKCSTSEEARNLYKKSPIGSLDEKIYKKQWTILSNQEAVSKALNCKRSEEAKNLYDRTPAGSLAEKIYWKRWIELSDKETGIKSS